MDLKPDTRLRGGVCSTGAIAVRAPTQPLELCCAGRPMVQAGEGAPPFEPIDPVHDADTALGKRFADPGSGLEVPCTKAGEGSLVIGGVPLALKDANRLAPSD